MTSPFRSLRHFLAIFVLAVVLPSLLFGVLLTWWSARQFLDDREQEAHRLAAATAESVRDHLETNAAFTTALSRVVVPRDWLLGLADGQGRLILHRDGESRTGEQVPRPVVEALGRSGMGGLQGISFADGPMDLFFHRVPGTEWTALVAIPESALYTPIRWQLGLLAAGLATVLLLTILLARRFIRQLDDAAGRLVAVARDPVGESLPGLIALEEFEEVARELKAVAAKRQQLMAALDLSASVIRDMDGTIRHWTAGAEQLTGWPREEALGRCCRDLLKPEYPEPLDSINAGLQKNGEWMGELGIVCRDGRVARVSTRFKLHTLEAGKDPVVVETFSDISAETLRELSLRSSQARLRIALNAARMFIFEYDALDDRVQREGRLAATLGIGMESTGKDYFCHLHPDDRAEFMAILEGLTPLKPAYTFEYRIRKPDGGYRWLADHARAEFDSHRQLVRLVGIAVDITERKQAELSLAREQELLAQIVENVPALLFVYDPAGKRMRLNRHAEAVLGWSNRDANDGDFLARVFPDPARREAAAEFIGRMDPEWQEWSATARDGTEIPVDWANFRLSDGTRIGIAIDLRQRKASEGKLARHAERQALLLEVASGLLQVRRDRRALACWIFDLVSSHLQAGVGFNFRLDKRDGALDLVACFGVPDEIQADYRRFEAGKGICSIAAATGESIVLDAVRIGQEEAASPLRALNVQAYACHPLLANDGSVLGTFSLGCTRRTSFTPEEADFFKTLSYFIAMAWERDQAEMEIQRLNADLERRVEARTAQLEASNRELQGFTYAASHDLKGPLGRINSFSSLLERRCRERLDEEGLMFLDFIRTNATRLSILLDDLLAHAQMDTATYDLLPLDLEGMVRQTLEEKADDARGIGAEFRLRFPEEPVYVLGSRHGLAQVLRNLVGNALKYSSSSQGPVVEIGARREGERCRLWVKDNGIGFDMAYHDKIFQIFRRLHTYDEFPGSGIGLALVKKAMDRMQGKVWAESTPGQGATFYLEMRVQAPPETQGRETP